MSPHSTNVFVSELTTTGHYLRAPASSAIFITVIVKVPAIQISAIVMGIIMIALDYPAPFVKETRIHRAIALRIPLLLLQASLAVLFYQVRTLSLSHLEIMLISTLYRVLTGRYGLFWLLWLILELSHLEKRWVVRVVKKEQRGQFDVLFV